MGEQSNETVHSLNIMQWDAEGVRLGEKNTSKLPKTQRHLCMLYTLIMHMDFPSQDMKSTDKTEEIDQRVESCLL